MALSITSTEFKMDGTIPKRFTCDGENISPKLIFAGIPVGTKSLALTMEDPDVPGSVLTHRIFDHWLVWNISPTAAGIEEGSTDAGTIGTNSAGRISYTGPCPPDREHRYIFTLYALDSLLDLPQGASKQKLLNGLSSHLLGKTVLVGKYNRK